MVTRMRVLVFGDSITQGYWDTEGGWVERLRKHYDTLQASDLEGRDEPTIFNLGISADNSSNVLGRIEAETTARTRHGNLPMIIIQIGVNDSSTDNQAVDKSVRVSIEDYENNLRKIVELVKPLSSKIIFVGLSACDEQRTTPVSWGDFHYTNESIKSYEDKMKDIAAEYGVLFIPVFDSFLEQLNDGSDYLTDGLHPNNKGHSFIFNLVHPELAKQF